MSKKLKMLTDVINVFFTSVDTLFF